MSLCNFFIKIQALRGVLFFLQFTFQNSQAPQGAFVMPFICYFRNAKVQIKWEIR